MITNFFARKRPLSETADVATPARGRVDKLEPQSDVKAKKVRQEPVHRHKSATEATKSPKICMAEQEVAARTSWEARSRAAATTWAAEDEKEKEQSLTSAKFTPSATFPVCFVTLAEALEANGDQRTRALCNLVRCALRGKDTGSLEGLVRIGNTTDSGGKASRSALASACIGIWKGFEMPSQSTVTEMADAIYKARRRQPGLSFSKSTLSLQDVAEALRSKEELPDRMQGLLRQATATHREIWHLVRVLCFQGPSSTEILRSFAHAVVMEAKGGLKAEFWGQAMATMEVLVAEAWAQRGHAEPSSLVMAILEAATEAINAEGRVNSTAFVKHCSPLTGILVRPMLLDEKRTAADAHEQMRGQACLIEPLLDGDRVQLHFKRSSQLQVHVGSHAHGSLGTEALQRLTAIVDESFTGTTAILDGMLMKTSKRAGLGAQKRKQSESTDAAHTANTAKMDRQEADCMDLHEVLVLFDILSLDGQALVGKSLRERRAILAAAVRERSLVRIVSSREVAAADVNDKLALASANEALAAHCVAKDPVTKTALQCSGAVLKVLDGKASRYVAGQASGAWRAVLRPQPLSGQEADARLLATLTTEERLHLIDGADIHFAVISGMRTDTEEGRHDIMIVEDLFKGANVRPKWYVDDTSVQAYCDLGLDAVRGGKLIPARNMALDVAMKEGKPCVQCSDDISQWAFYIHHDDRAPPPPKAFCASGVDEDEECDSISMDVANARSKTAEKLLVSPVAAARYMLAKMRSTPGEHKPRLGGVYPLGNTGMAFKCKPLGYTSFILGDFFCSDNSPCRFDLRMSLKEDYDLTCSHLQRHGLVLRLNRLVIQAKHETNAGGACAARDPDGVKERYNIGILREKWPGAFADNPRRKNQVILRWTKGAAAAAAEHAAKAS